MKYCLRLELQVTTLTPKLLTYSLWGLVIKRHTIFYFHKVESLLWGHFLFDGWVKPLNFTTYLSSTGSETDLSYPSGANWCCLDPIVLFSNLCFLIIKSQNAGKFINIHQNVTVKFIELWTIAFWIYKGNDALFSILFDLILNSIIDYFLWCPQAHFCVWLWYQYEILLSWATSYVYSFKILLLRSMNSLIITLYVENSIYLFIGRSLSFSFLFFLAIESPLLFLYFSRKVLILSSCNFASKVLKLTSQTSQSIRFSIRLLKFTLYR